MEATIRKYIGRTVEIIYLDGDGRITQRRVEIKSVRDGRMTAFCLQRRAPRLFRIDQVLAVRPTAGRTTA